MKFEWYLQHPDGTKCMPYITPLEYHAWYHATEKDMERDMVCRVHPAQLIYFEINQELCFGVYLETGFEYWVRRVE